MCDPIPLFNLKCQQQERQSQEGSERGVYWTTRYSAAK